MNQLPVLPGYRVERELGRGGMAAVYLAEQLSLRRKVAVKVLLHQGPDYRQVAERFLHEARTLAELRHPNVVIVHDVVASTEADFFAMEYLEGGSLADRLPAGVGFEQALSILAQLASALAAAHARGIVHRDVKPENVLFRDAATPVLTDFGIALQRRRTGPRLTETGVLLGTPTYMAPEQIRGQPVDARTDLYGLGVLFYELLTGQPPFDAAASEDVLIAHLAQPVPALPDRLKVLQPVLERMLAKQSHERYPDMPSMLADLGAALRRAPALLGVDAATGTPTERLRALGLPAAEPWAATRRLPLPADSDGASRTRTRIGLAVALAWALLAGAGYWWLGGERAASPQPMAALTAAERSVAVLPFTDMSEDSDSAHFADGLAEELIGTLSRLPGLRVAARTSSFQFRDRALDLREVGRALNVATVLEGSVRKSGARLRISAQLVDVSDGFQVWSARFDRQVDDIFAIQEEVAQAVADKLELTLSLTPGQRLADRGTRNADAFEQYLLARQAGRRASTEDHRLEIEHLENALRLDPGFARAHAQIARAQIVLYQRGAQTRAEALAAAEPRVQQALAMAPNDPEVQLAFAQLRQLEGDYAAAERALRRALESNPNDTVALGLLDYLLWEVGGREEEEREVLERAVSLDPLSPLLHYNLAELYVDLGVYERAGPHYRRAIAVAPDASFGHAGLGRYLWLVERDAEGALTAFVQGLQRDPQATRGYAFPALIWLDLGDLDAAAAWLERAPPGDESTLLRARTALAVRQGRMDAAAELLAPATARGGNRLLLASAGQLALLRGDLAQAERHFRALAGEDPVQPSRRNLRAVIGLGAVQALRGDAGRGRALLEAALEYVRALPPKGGAGALFGEVEILALLGRHDEAQSRMRELADAGVHPSVFADLWTIDRNPYLAGLASTDSVNAWLEARRLEAELAQERLARWRQPPAID